MKKKIIVLSFLATSFFFTMGSGLFTSDPEFLYAASESKEEIKLDVPFEPSEMEVVGEMLKIAQVNENDFVYDLGCGDGRIVITAAQRIGTRGVGVDLDPQRIKESMENARKAGVAGRVEFFQQDLFQTDIRQATVVMLYLWPEVNLRLRPKLLRELKPGTRVVSHSHDMGNWETDKSITAPNGHRVNFWVIPANVGGIWEWEMPGTKEKQRWVLRLQQQFQKVRGTLQAESHEVSLKNLEVKGEWLQFSAEGEVKGQTQTFHFMGRVRDHLLEGTLEESAGGAPLKHNWIARRDPSSYIPWE